MMLPHYIFIIAQLWLISHPRSTVVLLDTGTPGTSREIFSEDAGGETGIRNPLGYKPSALAIELTSSKAIAGKELASSLKISLLVPGVPVSSRTTILLG